MSKYKEGSYGYLKELHSSDQCTTIICPLCRNGSEFTTAAGRLEIISFLLRPPIYCSCSEDCNEIIGFAEPMISKEDALKLMGLE